MRAMKCYFLSLFSLLTVLLTPNMQAWGAEQSVGLVLSGGGAKGIAHIGVIKALEENDIPIDCITGTSMGAIVGGLYACGYSPDEMMQLLLSQYFLSMSTGSYDPSLTYYFSRPVASPQMFSKNFGDSGNESDKNKFDPQSLIAPTPMAFGFMELFSAYTAQCDADFSRLFVPYRCVASNVPERRKQVLSHGNVGDAIRASMSFPLVFQATKVDGNILYDGGIYDNFPVNVMEQDFNPDIMLGVDVSSSTSGPPNSFMDQLDLLVMQPQSYAVPADRGIKLRVDLDEFGLLDFGQAQAIYDIGYNKAMAMIDSIKGRVKARRPASEVASRRAEFKSRTPRLRFEKVCVTGGTKRQNEYLEHIFRPHKGSDTIGIDDARLAFYRAVSSDKLSSLTPQAELTNDSLDLFTLNLDARVKQNYSVGLGGYITSSNNSYLYMRAGYSSLSFNSMSADIEAWIGQSYIAGVARGSIDLPTAIPSAFRLLAVGSRRKYYETEKLFFRDNEPAFVTRHEYFGRLSWAMAAGRTGEFEVGAGGGRVYNSYFQNNLLSSYTDGTDKVKLDLAQAFASYESSTLDNISYPTSGLELYGRAAFMTGKVKYDRQTADEGRVKTKSNINWARLDLRCREWLSPSRHFSLGLEATATASTKRLLDDYYSAISTAPAYTPTPASNNMFDPGFRANSFIAASVTPVYKYNDRLSARFSSHVFVPARSLVRTEGGGVRYGKWFGSAHYMGEVDLVYNLPFASVCAYCNYATTQERFNIGISLGIYIPAPSFL